jgi:hypothetical protein
MTITEVLQDLGVPYIPAGVHKNVRTGWIGLNPCPWCGSTECHLGINIEHGYANCWHCGPVNPVSAITKLSGKSGIAVAHMLGAVDLSPREERPVGKYQEPFDTCRLMDCHTTYLRTRKIDPKVGSHLWGLKGIGPDGGNLAWRIFIPIMLHGKPVSWTTRAVGQRQGIARYLTAKPEQEEVSHREVLYGADYVRHAAIVVEGPFDAMRIGPGAVATLGIGVSDAQINLLSKIPVRAICFDSEERAQRKAREIARRLEPMEGETYTVQLSTGKDPATVQESEIRSLRKKFLDD